MYHFVTIGILSMLFSFSSDTVLVKESFSYPDGALPRYWWSEGSPATIRNGRLFINADAVSPRASSVWLDKELSGDMSIEFDVYLLSSADTANNINLFFMYSDPSGRELKQTATFRKDGLYKRYHELQGYIITNVTNGDRDSIRYRLRKNPGFQLMEQAMLSQHIRKAGIHIKLVRKGNQLQYWENGNKIFDKRLDEGDKLYEKGLFGFRTWHTDMEIDNLLIKRI